MYAELLVLHLLKRRKNGPVICMYFIMNMLFPHVVFLCERSLIKQIVAHDTDLWAYPDSRKVGFEK